MTQVNVKRPSAVISYTKWVGKYYIRCRQTVEKSGKTHHEFHRWVNARYCVSTRKMKPGYWQPVSAMELELRTMISQKFAAVLALKG